MERPIIESKKSDPEKNNSQISENQKAENEHAEAITLVEKHRDYFEHYARGRIKIEPAPKRLKTFAFDLEKNTIYINAMFYKKLGLSEEKTVFATLHEIEHLLEKIQLLSEDGGERIFDKWLGRIKKSRAFGLMDNCVADIRENRTVVSRTNTGMGELEEKIYKEDLFPETDFTKQQRHIQFCQAILREARVPSEQCQVSPEVRVALDEVKKVKGLMEVMTNPETPMSMRFRLQDKFIWPKVEELLEKDIEEKKKQQEEQEKQKGDDNQDGDAGGENGEWGEDEGEDGEESGDEQGGEDGDGGEDGQGDDEDRQDKDGQGQIKKKGKKTKLSKKGKKGEKSESDDGGNSNSEKPDLSEETDPNKIFADEYDEVESKFPEAIPLEEIEKAFKEWKEAQKEKNSPDKMDEDYAKKIGVEKKDLQKYREIVQKIEQIVNPETGVGIREELKNLFSRIISKRMKKVQAPKYPVEEGDELVDPAQLIADVKSGNLNPKVWEDTEIREKRGDRFGEVEITLVCDRSDSMNDGDGQKAEEQRKSAVLVMEVLKEFAEMCEAEKMEIDKPLEIRSEIYGFGAGNDQTPMKKMSSELGEAERINILKDLHHLPGSTTDFNCLGAIDRGLDQNTKDKIKTGELKKIVIIFTDGGSDDPTKVQGILKSLREDGVVAIGVGITKGGAPVLSTYAPNALVVEDVSKLPIILGELLKEHLKDI
jgi:hypothetical protein